MLAVVKSSFEQQSHQHDVRNANLGRRLGMWHSPISNLRYSPKNDFCKEQNITTMQMELNYDSLPQSAGKWGREENKWKLVPLLALCDSGAWELQQLGLALRNILSCNVNMPELWSSRALRYSSPVEPRFLRSGFAGDIRSPLIHFLSGVMTLGRKGCLKFCQKISCAGHLQSNSRLKVKNFGWR